MASNLIDLLEASVKECDNISTVILDLKKALDIDNTYGVWLDIVAEIVGETPRLWIGSEPGITDIEFQERIKVRIELNGGFGTIENVMQAIRRYALLDPESGYWGDVKDAVVITEEYWANILAEVYKGSQDLVNNIRGSVTGGVGLQVVSVPDNVFTIGDDDGNVTDPGNSGGLGDENDPEAGGALAELLI